MVYDANGPGVTLSEMCELLKAGKVGPESEVCLRLQDGGWSGWEKLRMFETWPHSQKEVEAAEALTEYIRTLQVYLILSHLISSHLSSLA
jgi:hypothetical protein